MGVKIVFADIDANLNIDVKHVAQLITPKTKASVCVHYGGLPCDMDELWELGRKHNIAIIEDAAHAVGAKYKGEYIGSQSDFTMFSFQAIKHITTGDGGMLVVKDHSLVEKAKRLRWFGIDRSSKQKGIWENDIMFKHGILFAAMCLNLTYISIFLIRKKIQSILASVLVWSIFIIEAKSHNGTHHFD
jgi:dTDP-4-amino-4,6-dideoxygalactose transaminase